VFAFFTSLLIIPLLFSSYLGYAVHTSRDEGANASGNSKELSCLQKVARGYLARKHLSLLPPVVQVNDVVDYRGELRTVTKIRERNQAIYLELSRRNSLPVFVLGQQLHYYAPSLAAQHFPHIKSKILRVVRPCRESETITAMVECNSFMTYRTLENYYDDFPEEFFERLNKLEGAGHWVDMGSGESFALQEFFESRFHAHHELPDITGVTIVSRSEVPTFDGKLTILKGRPAEDIGVGEFKKPADIITDYYGAFSYSARLSQLLTKYFELLKEDGVIFINTSDPEVYSDLTTQIEISAWEVLTVFKWLEENPTIKVEVIRPRSSKAFEDEGGILPITIKMQRIPGVEPHFPQMKLIYTDHKFPPTRIFAVDEE
jgi:hypothetical protein